MDRQRDREGYKLTDKQSMIYRKTGGCNDE